MGAEAKIGGTYTLVHAKKALSPSCLQQSVQDPPVHEALERVREEGRAQRSTSEPTRVTHLPRQHLRFCFSTPSFPCQPEPYSTSLPCLEYQWVGYKALCWLHQRVSWPGLLPHHSPWQPPEPPSSSGEERSRRKRKAFINHTSHLTLGQDRPCPGNTAGNSGSFHTVRENTEITEGVSRGLRYPF